MSEYYEDMMLDEVFWLFERGFDVVCSGDKQYCYTEKA